MCSTEAMELCGLCAFFSLYSLFEAGDSLLAVSKWASSFGRTGCLLDPALGLRSFVEVDVVCAPVASSEIDLVPEEVIAATLRQTLK